VKAIRVLIYSLLALATLLLVAAQFGALAGKPPADLGVRDGRLKPPSLTPNSVSSQAILYPEHPQRSYATIHPLPLKSGGATASVQTLTQVLQTLPGVTLVERKPDYLYAQSQTRWLQFVDDMEFWVNAGSGAIEVRSASRLGHSDLGTNRQRIETIRQAYLTQP
jgi:uncharacterized protein (DUF1499 family)